MRVKVENCYQCANYHTCYLRISMDDLLDIGHHKLIVGGKAALRNSTPLTFLEKLSKICNVKEFKNV